MLNKFKLFGLGAGAALMVAGRALQSCFMPKSDNIFGASWCIDGASTTSNGLFAFHNSGHCAGCFAIVLGAVIVSFTLYVIAKSALKDTASLRSVKAHF